MRGATADVMKGKNIINGLEKEGGGLKEKGCKRKDKRKDEGETK